MSSSSFVVVVCLAVLCYFVFAPSAEAAVTRYAFPLSANGSQIIDSNGTVAQMRCANWPGHIDLMLPEGLQWAPIATIVDSLVGTDVFNCIRFTYAVDLFYEGSTLTVRQSIQRFNLSVLIADIEKNNPNLIDQPLIAAFDAVVTACNEANIMVLFDNQVSNPSWCCSDTDGNGWWNDQYFNVSRWLYSLSAIAAHFNHPQFDNVVAFSLRNELRTSTLTYQDQLRDWYQYVPLGLEALQRGNPSALKFVSGLDYDCNLAFLNDPYDNKTHWQKVFTGYAAHLVFEAHIYSWSGFGNNTDDCSQILPEYYGGIGWPLQNNRPLVLTETGLVQRAYPNNQNEFMYWHCLAMFILKYRVGFGIWVYGGSYMYLHGTINSPDPFGTLNSDFNGYAGPAFLKELQSLIIRTDEAKEELIAA